MTVDDPRAAPDVPSAGSATPPGGPDAPGAPNATAADPGRAALERHMRTMRRQRRWYLAVLAAVVAAVAALVGAVWSTSEIAHAHLHTASAPAPTVTSGPMSARPALRWRSTDAAAIGMPFSGGTVVTYSAHTVTGRDALTGATVWSYTRTDRSVCQVIQASGKTIAVFDDGRNCDEADTFETGTGQRAWDRTLDENAMPIDGRPALVASTDTAFIWTGSVIYAIDPASGYDRWTLQPDAGCAFTAVVPGSAGVLISESCSGGAQLLLRDRYAAADDKQQTEDKKQQIVWRRSHTSTLPVAADNFVAAFDSSSRSLVVYDSRTGRTVRSIALTPPPSANGPVRQASAPDGELIWIGGRSYSLDATGTTVRWTAATLGLPTLFSPDSSTAASLAEGRLLVPAATGAAELSARTGRLLTTYPADTTGSGQVLPLGTGFLVAGTSTAVYQ